MSFIDFTPNTYNDIMTSQNSKPILNCSTINATIYNTTFHKLNKDYYYDSANVIVQWFDGFCDWINVNNEYFDNKYIPIELLLQITEFMVDPYNYIIIDHNDCH
jgi:hypothetical protein